MKEMYLHPVPGMTRLEYTNSDDSDNNKDNDEHILARVLIENM